MPEPKRSAPRNAAGRSQSGEASASLAGDLRELHAASIAVDEALEGLSASLGNLEHMTDRFASRWQGRGVDVRQVQAIVWAAHVHERLMQETGGFGRYLQHVHNTPSAWAAPVAGWVPTPKKLTARFHKFTLKGGADERR